MSDTNILHGSKEELEQLALKARATILERQRAGTWSGGVRPHLAYQKQPFDWIVKYLDVPAETLRWSLNEAYDTHTWDGDADPLLTVLQALAEWRDCGVESATGTGKTFLAACIVYWFIACFEDSIVLTVAPKEDQLLKHVWKEIGRLWPNFQKHFPDAELLTGTLRMKPAANGGKEVWAASALVCGVGATEEVATKAQGSHAEHMLIITEETPGIHLAIMEALDNTRTDDHNLHLALGNPDHRQDALHRFCFDEREDLRPGVVHVRISALDHPNIVTGQRVVPGAIGRSRLETRTNRLGLGSRLYESRVRGICPAEAEDALIKREWCDVAVGKYGDPAYRQGKLALGVDVANSEKGDKAAIARWQGACCTEVVAKPCPDANVLGTEVATESLNREAPVEARHIGVDGVGVGAGTVNELRRLKLRVRVISGAVKSIPQVDQDTRWSSMTEPDPFAEGKTTTRRPTGEKVVESEKYDNLRSQVWWRMREDLRLGRIALPPDEELLNDLTTPTYEHPLGVIKVESKDKIKDRLKRSPNKGDACVYGNFVRDRVPVGAVVEIDKVDRRNRDLGLERMLGRINRQQKADEKRMA
ncbi:MAG TPA: hypothetical protein VM243_20080, partial [Phycisphaerae bacterium]|nr:hypothetical protein [Phycisphaerae bacterium]